jgi:hypothetical protein
VLLERVIYSGAIAILAGMVCQRRTGRDPSWIMIAVALAPDIDRFVRAGLGLFVFTLLFHGHGIDHGDFHTILMVAVFAGTGAFALDPFGVRFVDSIVFTSLAVAAHLIEDALVYADGYPLFWPLSHQPVGLDWLPGTRSRGSSA